MLIRIEKRSGRIEDFNEDKIVRSITRAGAKPAVAKEVLGTVKQRIEDEGKSLIKTSILKEYVKDELEKVNPNVSRTYWEYIKPLQMMRTKQAKAIRDRQAKIRSKKTAQYDKPK
ncbi:MAG: ATP cone domain-containing protein [Nitrososphaerales archaeon]